LRFTELLAEREQASPAAISRIRSAFRRIAIGAAREPCVASCVHALLIAGKTHAKQEPLMKTRYLTGFAAVALLVPACIAQDGDLAGDEVVLDEQDESLTGPIDFDRCAHVLAQGIYDEYSSDVDSETAGILTDWVCSHKRDAWEASHEGSFDFLKLIGSGEQDWGLTKESLDEYCEVNQQPYNASSMSYHALTRIVNSDVIEAWRSCMTDDGREPFLCEPYERDGQVSFNMTLDSVNVHALNLTWPTMVNVKAAGTLPSSMLEGSLGADFIVKKRTETAKIRLVATAGRAGDPVTAQYTCELQIDPIEPISVPRPVALLSGGKCLSQGQLSTCKGGDADRHYMFTHDNKLMNVRTGMCAYTTAHHGVASVGSKTCKAASTWFFKNGRIVSGASSTSCIVPDSSKGWKPGPCASSGTWTQRH
jgi:hypothetical protein